MGTYLPIRSMYLQWDGQWLVGTYVIWMACVPYLALTAMPRRSRSCQVTCLKALGGSARNRELRAPKCEISDVPIPGFKAEKMGEDAQPWDLALTFSSLHLIESGPGTITKSWQPLRGGPSSRRPPAVVPSWDRPSIHTGQ